MYIGVYQRHLQGASIQLQYVSEEAQCKCTTDD